MNLTDLLSNEVLESLSKSTGASKADTSKVLANALPVLMKSMASNASTKEGAKSLEKALDAHSSNDMLSTLLKNIDMEDGTKILGHILGKNSDSVKSTVSKKSGVDSDLTSIILASAAPLLLSALGSEKKKSGTKADGLTDLLGSLLGKENDSDNDIADTLFSLAGALLSDSSSKSSKGSSKKSSKNDGIDLGDIINIAGKLLG
jgi:hypothetical protein